MKIITLGIGSTFNKAMTLARLIREMGHKVILVDKRDEKAKPAPLGEPGPSYLITRTRIPDPIPFFEDKSPSPIFKPKRKKFKRK